MIPANCRKLRHRPSPVALLIICVSALACNVPGRRIVVPTLPPVKPVVTPAQVSASALPATQTPAPDVFYQGTSFSYHGSLANHVEATGIPAVGTPDGPEWAVAPAHLQFTLAGYVVPDRFHSPRILIYPVSEYENLSETAASMIDALQLLLAEKPATPETIPFLPVWNAVQLTRAKVTYLDFQNGAGVRFLAQYSQAATPINNYELFYGFQGITADGAYYVSAILPVSSPLLPSDSATIPGGGNYDAFVERYAAYLEDVTAQLGVQSDSEFAPDLTLLDNLITSLRVT